MPVTIDYRFGTDEYQTREAYIRGVGRRDIPGFRWADVLRVLVEHLGLPAKFFTRDFLTSMIFAIPDHQQVLDRLPLRLIAEDVIVAPPTNGGNGNSAEITAVFCSQGRRRGQVLLSMPAAAQGAAELMDRLGKAMEARRAAVRQAAIDSGIPADYLDAEEEDPYDRYEEE